MCSPSDQKISTRKLTWFFEHWRNRKKERGAALQLLCGDRLAHLLQDLLDVIGYKEAAATPVEGLEGLVHLLQRVAGHLGLDHGTEPARARSRAGGSGGSAARAGEASTRPRLRVPARTRQSRSRHSRPHRSPSRAPRARRPRPGPRAPSSRARAPPRRCCHPHPRRILQTRSAAPRSPPRSAAALRRPSIAARRRPALAEATLGFALKRLVAALALAPSPRSGVAIDLV